MRILRLYRINKVLLEHGLDELIPAKWLPWYARFYAIVFFGYATNINMPLLESALR